MKLSKRGEYALRSLINLGIAREVGRELVRATELAEHEQLPVKFLEQILQALKEAGLVESERGKFGGYRLAKPAQQISIGQVVRLMDGPIAPIGCVSQTAYAKCSCPDEEHCGLRMLMLDVRNAIAGIVDRYTLADVVAVTLRKLRTNGRPHALEADSPRPAARSRGPAPRATGAASRGRTERPLAARLHATEGVLHQLFGDYSI